MAFKVPLEGFFTGYVNRLSQELARSSRNQPETSKPGSEG